jgi:hypothetical protein
MNTNIPPALDLNTTKVAVDLLFAGLTAIGTIAVAVLAIWGDWFKARFAPAKLKIVRDEPLGDLTHLSDERGAPLPAPNRLYFYHLKVVNKRRWVSPKNCRVLLKTMSIRGPDGIFHPIPMAVPLHFVWAPAEITPALVAIEDEQVFDFGLVTEKAKVFIPRLYSMSNNFQGIVAVNQAIRYSLQIVSDTYVSPRYQVFEVAFDGVWTPDRLEMQNHLRIREIEG